MGGNLVPALTSEHSKVTHIGFVSCPQFVWSSVCFESLRRNSISDVASVGREEEVGLRGQSLLDQGRKTREGYGQAAYQVYSNSTNPAPLFMSIKGVIRENYWTWVERILLWSPACPTRLTRVQHQKHQIIRYGHAC